MDQPLGVKQLALPLASLPYEEHGLIPGPIRSKNAKLAYCIEFWLSAALIYAVAIAQLAFSDSHFVFAYRCSKASWSSTNSCNGCFPNVSLWNYTASYHLVASAQLPEVCNLHGRY